MSSNLILPEPVEQARTFWNLAHTHCGQACRSYHGLRGILHGAQIINGLRVDAPVLGPALAERLHPHSRVLIAGAADASLLDLVISSTTARPLSIHVVDLCPTPLAFISSLAEVAGVSITTEQNDLVDLAQTEAFDLIISHQMIPFVPAELRGTVLKRLCAAMAPGGVLALTIVTGNPATKEDHARHLAVWIDNAFARLDAHPELAAVLGDQLREVILDYAERYRSRQGSFASPADIATLMEDSGFHVAAPIRSHEGEVSKRASMGRRNNLFLATSSSKA